MIRRESGLLWFKSSYSDSSNGNDCVEIATTPALVHVRDSKSTAEGPRLALGPTTWTEFISFVSGS
ncbi:DUF397 domain-containing protein [Streptomyces geranii]|uniref:DUF397 domain-containing protein n=1 Tax=Streptomyces geranii TaxID=2058923 RepID=UPI000D0441BA|nr:DUF397 domain-containing protein [Streptomyces geranii]